MYLIVIRNVQLSRELLIIMGLINGIYLLILTNYLSFLILEKRI